MTIIKKKMSSENDITFTSDSGDPGFSCDHCGTEMEDRVGGYWKDDVRYCCHCACDLFDQPEPISAYQICRQQKEECDEWFTRLTCEYTGPEEHDPRYDYDSLQENVFRKNIYSRSYDWDPKPEFELIPFVRRELSEEDLSEEDLSEEDELPGSVEELYESLADCKAVCFTCGDFNYASKIFDAGRMRMLCGECYSKTICCQKCENISIDTHYYIHEFDHELCFDCYFDKPMREQMSLEDHLQKIIVIQRLSPQHIEVLSNYASLCQIPFIQAYDYKSRCHMDSCEKRLDPSIWNADLKTQFCSELHCKYFEDYGHLHPQYHTSFDEDYNDATCKVCYSTHDAISESNQGVGPVVSAICMFNKLRMSNVLFDSLTDLCAFY